MSLSVGDWLSEGVDMTRSILATISDANLGAWRVIRRLFLNIRLMSTVLYPIICGGSVPIFVYISTSLILFMLTEDEPMSCMERQHLDSLSYVYANGSRVIPSRG
jgi:hypothetical protein